MKTSLAFGLKCSTYLIYFIVTITNDLINIKTLALFSYCSFYFSAAYDVVDHILFLYILFYLGSSDTLHFLNVCAAIRSSFCTYSLFLSLASVLPLCDLNLLDHCSQPRLSLLIYIFFN